jgi:hypothetical protein
LNPVNSRYASGAGNTELVNINPPQSPLVMGEVLKPPLIRGGLEGLISKE